MENLRLLKPGFISGLSRTILFAGFVLSAGCTTHFGEQHFFQMKNEETGEVSNYFRLTVSGYATMSSARYVSGFYDERAVDLFFNELKLGKTPESVTADSKLFQTDQLNPGTTEKISPLSPSNENGAFVMVLSTNASAVTNTIGQFAESQVVADAVSNLANRKLLSSDARKNQSVVLSANTAASEIDGLMKLLPEPSSASQDEAEKSLLRVLNAIARGVTPQHEALATLDLAADWLAQVKQVKQ